MGALDESYVLRVLLAPRSEGGSATFARSWRWLRPTLFDGYRPELHYMRGPGPKWREKHAAGRGRLAAALE
jgi:hypothetical protein